jgi:ABC-2 type transport system permease protein
MLMFADIAILPPAVQVAMYSVPYTHSILASKAAFMGDYATMLISIGYISLFTVAILYVTARIFSTERIITARISFGRRGQRNPTA